jgi:phosphate transport system substrate-binding protein
MFAIAISALLILSSPAPAAPTAVELTARGSDSTIALVKALAESYTKATGQALKLEGGGSGKGAEACAKGEVDFCFLSRGLKDAEKKLELVGRQYAFDGVAVIVNNANPVEDATVEQVRDWFTGTVPTWADGKGIVLFNRNADSGTRELFQDAVLKGAAFSDKAAVKHDGVILSSVAKIPTSLAFTSAGELTAEVKAVRVNGVAPTRDNLRSGTYPLARTLTFATKGEAKPEVKAFIDWVLSKDGQAIVEKVGYTAIVRPEPPAPAEPASK